MYIYKYIYVFNVYKCMHILFFHSIGDIDEDERFVDCGIEDRRGLLHVFFFLFKVV